MSGKTYFYDMCLNNKHLRMTLYTQQQLLKIDCVLCRFKRKLEYVYVLRPHGVDLSRCCQLRLCNATAWSQRSASTEHVSICISQLGPSSPATAVSWIAAAAAAGDVMAMPCCAAFEDVYRCRIVKCVRRFYFYICLYCVREIKV